MPLAQLASGHDGAEIHVANLALSVSQQKIKVSIQGKLGFDCWKTFFQARQIALEKNLPLQVEVGRCSDADMAGIGALLVAIERLGDIEIADCTELSRYWFSNFGICQGCSNKDSTSACPHQRMKC